MRKMVVLAALALAAAHCAAGVQDAERFDA